MGKNFKLLNKDTKQPLNLETVEIAIYICGFLSETSITMVFRDTRTDTTAADVEGELVSIVNYCYLDQLLFRYFLLKTMKRLLDMQ